VPGRERVLHLAGMVSRRASAAVAALALATLAPGAARAGLWPQPAMGPSRSGDPELVLSFDDGPHPTITPQLLDMLEAHDLHAVFFWVGWRITRAPETAREIVERAVAEGHVIANHTINHAQLCTVEDHVGSLEIDGAKAILEDLAHMPVVWFRSPYGARCLRLEGLLADRHLSHFHWDLDPQEWKNPSVKRTVAYVTSHLARLGDGQRAVLLLHDTKVGTLHALPQILDWIVAENKVREAEGRRTIRFVSAPQLAIEQLDPDLREWATGTAAAAAEAFTNALAGAVP
jgi:peptidoglycan/xylan/chitin deacetylase (PgdA/CDA1 family)